MCRQKHSAAWSKTWGLHNIEMAHALPEARSVLMLRATRCVRRLR
jgi:hypothetical protein